MLIIRHIMQNPFALGFMSWCLVFVPIMGMWAVHNYGWEHWEPFSKKHYSKDGTDSKTSK
jgi:hypothetical protein